MKDLDLTNLKSEDLDALKARIDKEKMRRKPKKTRIFCHRDKESNWDMQEELCLNDDQMMEFQYTGYEVFIDIEIDENGKALATHFQNVELPEKVRV